MTKKERQEKVADIKKRMSELIGLFTKNGDSESKEFSEIYSTHAYLEALINSPEDK